MDWSKMYEPDHKGEISYESQALSSKNLAFYSEIVDGVQFNFQQPISLLEYSPIVGISGYFVGRVVGYVFNFIMYSASNPIEHSSRFSSLSTKDQIITSWKSNLKNGTKLSKTFGIFAGYYGFFQCFIAKKNASESISTHVLAGFSTGALVNIRNGIRSMAKGGLGIGLFSYVIEKYMRSK